MPLSMVVDCLVWLSLPSKEMMKAFMWRAWYLHLCLECWCCYMLAEGVVLNFLVEVDCCLIFLMPLSIIVDSLMMLLLLSSKEVLKGIHKRAWYLCLCLEPWCSHVLAEGAVLNFFNWGWLLFNFFNPMEHDHWLFDVAIVITIKRGDYGHLYLADCFHTKVFVLIFSGWGWLLFDVVLPWSMIIECLMSLFVIAIERGDWGCSCLTDCCHPSSHLTPSALVSPSCAGADM